MGGDAAATASLNRLGLEHYGPAFRDNRIDRQILPSFTADDLTEIGVTAAGHRRNNGV
jgi:SAM domain (Sterile alpha motif)